MIFKEQERREKENNVEDLLEHFSRPSAISSQVFSDKAKSSLNSGELKTDEE